MKHKLDNYKGYYLVVLLFTTTVLSKIILPIILNPLINKLNISSYVLIFISQIFAYLIPIIVLIFLTSESNKMGFNNIKLFNLSEYNRKTNVLIILALTITFYMFIHFLTDFFLNLTIYFTKDISVAEPITNISFSNFLSLALVFAFMPALIEEVTYRGLYYSAFNKNKYILFMIPTFVFALSHGSIVSIITAIMLGTFLMIIMDKTKNLKLLIACHFVYNLISLVFSNYIATPISPSTFISEVNHINVVLGASLINLSLALFFLFLVLYIYYKTEKNINVSSKNYEQNDISIKEKQVITISSILLCIIVITTYILILI